MNFNLNQPTIDIVYQDNDFIAINKPAELLCVPGLSDPDNLFDRVKKSMPNARVVHRLDMSTSGLVLFALHHQAQKQLGKIFEHRQIQKSYVALVSGIVSCDYGDIESPLICDWPNRPKQHIDWQQGKAASTYFRVIKRDEERAITRMQLKPYTGRTHQLRVHMLQIGHPIIGDRFYKNNESENKADRMCLHAEQLFFTHPITKKHIHIAAEATF
ncbi:RluA family pseudouridine synthase [Agarilytica rhodophyticola]|uniref:RluA family pseudouridine synthase n=1 Tax=Agarilytica rhodophyticola TaxID=1737490 RepID=UPI000B348E42|nr:RluA family pseudouridine synthase [Agarilytica rhodophyticola]